jgi:hypothetical protein
MQPIVMVVPSGAVPPQPPKDAGAEIRKIQHIAAASVVVNATFLICMLGSWGTPEWLRASLTTPLFSSPILSVIASLSTVTVYLCTYPHSVEFPLYACTKTISIMLPALYRHTRL